MAQEPHGISGALPPAYSAFSHLVAAHVVRQPYLHCATPFGRQYFAQRGSHVPTGKLYRNAKL